MSEGLKGIFFWGGIAAGLFVIRPRSILHRTRASALGKKQSLLLTAVILVLIALVILWTTLSPMWNGQIIDHKGQYEMITESFLQGRLDLDLPVDPRLAEMENPYDPQLRAELGVEYFHDHAYYDGHYYMYFGVVPVFLAFLPFRLIFGQELLSVHATQWFSALFILGLAACFLWLIRRKFPRMTLGMLILLLALFSLLSLLYPAKFPSLYQTPVACGMMLEIWSIFCFFKAFSEKREGLSFVRWAWIGSLLGALTFGCRPTLALANLVVIPLFLQSMKGRRMSVRLAGRLLLAVSPYLLVAAGLMWYNFARFHNPLEFGQAYQLTTADQSGYGGLPDFDGMVRALLSAWNALFALPPLTSDFPFLALGCGVFTCCPLLLFALRGIHGAGRNELQEKGMHGFAGMIVISAVIILIFQALWSPFPLDRYKSDVLYLLSVDAFIGIGAWFSGQADPEKSSWKICLAALLCILLVFLLFLIPDDFSYTQFFSSVNEHLWRNLTFRPE